MGIIKVLSSTSSFMRIWIMFQVLADVSFFGRFLFGFALGPCLSNNCKTAHFRAGRPARPADWQAEAQEQDRQKATR